MGQTLTNRRWKPGDNFCTSSLYMDCVHSWLLHGLVQGGLVTSNNQFCLIPSNGQLPAPPMLILSPCLLHSPPHFPDNEVQFSSAAQLCLTLCDPMHCSTPDLPVHHQLPEFTQTYVHELAMPSNHLILCCPLLLPPSIFPSIRVFSNESVLHVRWPTIGVSASASVLPINIQGLYL